MAPCQLASQGCPARAAPCLPAPTAGRSTYPCSSPAGSQCLAGCHPGPALPSAHCGSIPQTRSVGNQDRNVSAELGTSQLRTTYGEWLWRPEEGVGSCSELSLQTRGSPDTSPASLPCLCQPFPRESCCAWTGSTERSLPGLAALGLQFFQLNASHKE